MNAFRERWGPVNRRERAMHEEIEQVEEVDAEELPEFALMVDIPD
ncbi:MULTISPECIES: hypothetical protein [unclassified Streptomyces]